MNVGKTFKAIGTFVSKNSPVITAVAAVGGLITTVVVACKATPKYLLAIDNAIAEKGEELTKKEKAKIFVKAYGTTIVAGVVTSGAIIASPLLMKKNCDKVLTGALAAYTVAENKLEKLNTAIKEELPKKEQDKVKTNYVKQMVADNPVPEGLVAGPNEMIFCDSFTGAYFVGTVQDIENVRIWLNSELQKRKRDGEGVRVTEYLEKFGTATYGGAMNHYEWNTRWCGDDPLEFELSGAYEENRQRTVAMIDWSVDPELSERYL